MTESLYVRLGEQSGIEKIASDLVDNHLANPTIAARFAGSDVSRLKRRPTRAMTCARCMPT
jgi:hemoglobin